MPLISYTIIHRDAVLTSEESELLIKWAKAIQIKMTPVSELESVIEFKKKWLKIKNGILEIPFAE